MKVISFKKIIILISLLGVVFYVVPEYFLFKGKEYRFYNYSNDEYYEKLDYLDIAAKFPGYKKEIGEIKYEIGYEFGIDFQMSYNHLYQTINEQTEKYIFDSLDKIYDSTSYKKEFSYDLYKRLSDKKDLVHKNTIEAYSNNNIIRTNYILDNHILLMDKFCDRWEKPINNMPLEKNNKSFINYYKVKKLIKE